MTPGLKRRVYGPSMSLNPVAPAPGEWQDPRTLQSLFPGYGGEQVNLGVLGPPPSTMETVGALAPLAGAAVMAPSLPLALMAIPAYHFATSGALSDLPSIPSMPGEPWLTLADLITGVGGKGAGDAQTAAVRYRRPGVSPEARAAAERMHRAPVADPIAERGAVFHATDPQSVGPILKAGEIVPDPFELQARGLERWEDLARLKPLQRDKPAPPELFARLLDVARKDPNVRRNLNQTVAFRAYGSGLAADQPARIDAAINDWLLNPDKPGTPRMGYDISAFAESIWGSKADKVLASLGFRYPSSYGAKESGVSVSRVPRVSSKGSRAVSFVIDPAKMPPSRPFAESGYGKVEPQATWGLQERANPPMNPLFEYENRTFNQAIPRKAIREMWVDRSAVPGGLAPDLRDLAAQYGIPLREFESGREMHRGRVRKKK